MVVKKVSVKKEIVLAAPETEFDFHFVQAMANRMAVSFHKYGSVEDLPESVDCVASAWQCMTKYHQTGNSEYLADAANYLMMEKMRAGEEAFVPTDETGSVGRVVNGKVGSKAKNK